MIRIFNSDYVFRFFIFVFWICLIFIFLYFPFFKNVFLEKNTLNILTWADMVDLKTVAKFQEQSGIKVNVNYYENNEELFAKLQVTQGQEYDLIIITDSGVNYLKRKDLLKKIDKTKLNFWDNIEPKLTDHYFDPQNEYSIPYNWDIYGLGINLKNFPSMPEASWNLIFDPTFTPKKISMSDDAYDAILIAAKYLFGSIESIDKNKLQEIKKLLIKQKQWVEVYTDLRADYFLKAGICPVVVAQSAYIYRAIMHNGNNNFAFLIPKEGTFLVIDSFVIPKLSKKDDLIYKLVNFLFQEEEIIKFAEKFGFLPTMKNALNSLNLDYIGGLENIFGSFNSFSFFKRIVPREDVSKLWIEVRAA